MSKKFILFPAIISLLILFAACETQQTTVKVSENAKLPKKIKVIAQSCDATSMYQTVIDLENNEIVILIYNEQTLINIIRTGINADPDKQSILKGKDAPDAALTRSRAPHGTLNGPF
jgi:hypothetical protein